MFIALNYSNESAIFFQGHEASSKEASAKEVEARLNAMKQHNELQQELLQHVLQYHDTFSSIENLAAAAVGTDSELSGTELRDRLKGSLVRDMCCCFSSELKQQGGRCRHDAYENMSIFLLGPSNFQRVKIP